MREGDSPSESCLIVSGFAARYNLLDDGRRQITAVHVAGDFIDLHSLLLSKMDHSVAALNDCEISMVPHELLKRVTEEEAHFGRMLWLMTVIDAAIFRRWLVAAGRLSSSGQIAHFLCEMFTRLEVIGEVVGTRFNLPLSQAELSDAMGLSVVHVNRTLQQLRKSKLIEWSGEEVRILDLTGLKQVAQFDPTYLDLNCVAR